jgi:hypothetical protein
MDYCTSRARIDASDRLRIDTFVMCFWQIETGVESLHMLSKYMSALFFTDYPFPVLI